MVDDGGEVGGSVEADVRQAGRVCLDNALHACRENREARCHNTQQPRPATSPIPHSKHARLVGPWGLKLEIFFPQNSSRSSSFISLSSNVLKAELCSSVADPQTLSYKRGLVSAKKTQNQAKRRSKKQLGVSERNQKQADTGQRRQCRSRNAPEPPSEHPSCVWKAPLRPASHQRLFCCPTWRS